MKVPQSIHGSGSRGKRWNRLAVHSTVLRSFKLKRTFLFAILALVAAATLPMMATSQVAKAKRTADADQAETVYKWEGYGGFAYTSTNNINSSRSGLMGAKFGVTRDWGRFFGVTAEGAFYSKSFSNPAISDSTQKPKETSVLFGPVLHATLYGHLSGFVDVLLGGEHIGGTSQTPNISFAGGAGGGMEWKFSQHLAARAYGDDIASSFSLINNSPALGNSPHKTWSSRAGIGIVYKF